MDLFEDEAHGAGGADEAGEFYLSEQSRRVEHLRSPGLAFRT